MSAQVPGNAALPPVLRHIVTGWHTRSLWMRTESHRRSSSRPRTRHTSGIASTKSTTVLLIAPRSGMFGAHESALPQTSGLGHDSRPTTWYSFPVKPASAQHVSSPVRHDHGSASRSSSCAKALSSRHISARLRDFSSSNSDATATAFIVSKQVLEHSSSEESSSLQCKEKGHLDLSNQSTA
jgi:hypothetical protein